MQNFYQKNIISHKLSAFRTKEHMSQQELSDEMAAIGISVCRGSISRIEDGLRAVSDIELVGFAKVLNVSVMDLLGMEC